MSARHARALALVGVSCFALATAGCGDDTSTRGLVIELAQRPAAGSCANESIGMPALPSTGCLVIRVWEGTGVERHLVPLYRTTDDHAGAGSTELRVEITESRRVTFDGRFTDAPHEVEVALFSSTDHAPIAGGANRHAVLGDSPVRVRLYSYGAWSCAGQRDGSPPQTQLRARAMHAQTSLPNGDVLIYGGVTGLTIPVKGDGGPVMGGPVAEPSVEVYIAREERFAIVNGTFNRVLFGSILLPNCPVGVSRSAHCIRIVGGLETPEGQALRFSESQALRESALGSPVLPGTGAVLPVSGSSVLLVYEPDTRSLTTMPDNLAGVSRTAFVTATDFGAAGDLTSVIVGSVLDTGGATFSPSFDSSGALLRADGRVTPSIALGQNRLAAAVARLRVAGDDFLVWGGNIPRMTESPNADAGRLLRVTGPGMATAGIVATDAPSGVPAPVAFHTLTPIGDSGVLLAGGLRIGPVGSAETVILRLSPPPGARLVFLRADPMAPGGIVGSAAVDASYEPTILHTATRLPNGEVLLVAGSKRAVRPPGTLDFELYDIQQVIRATRASPTAITWRAEVPMLEGRFGHAASLLEDGRLLVTGGFRRNTADTLDALTTAEVLAFDPAPAAIDACTSGDFDAGAPPRDAGVTPVDAGPPSARDAGFDADLGAMPPDAG